MRRLTLVLVSVIALFLLLTSSVWAAQCGDTTASPDTNPVDFWKAVENDCQQKIRDTQSQKQTLNSALKVLESKARLITAQIKQTASQIASLENDINTLSNVVNDLDKSVSQLTPVLQARIRESYIHREPNPIVLFLSSDSFAQFFTRMRYLSVVKARDQLILSEMEKAKTDYDAQKQTKSEKQKQVADLKTQLEGQQLELSRQQRAKKDLLLISQNNEDRYQRLLQQAIAELSAVQDIIAHKGVETESRDVNKGDVIAHVLQGASCNSNGTHLHFTVADNSTDLNPFNYLKPVDYLDNSGGDPFNPTGSWDWPLTGRIRFNQGYGETWAIKNLGLWYSRHNGVDISGDSNEVRAVQPGKLYLGSYDGNNGCLLKYVRVRHKDGGLDTYYLHVNYN